MRLSILLILACFGSALLGGCSCGGSAMCDNSRIGEAGGCCRSDGCNAGLSCQNAACQACGAADAACCPGSAGGEPTCADGLRCVSPAMGAEVCRACGGVGQPCCSDASSPACASGAACISDVCQSASSVCAPGSDMFNLGVVDANGCGVRVIAITTDTLDDARNCAATMLRTGETLYDGGDGTDRLVSYEVCVHDRTSGDRTAPVQAFDDWGARTCACMTPDPLGCMVDYHACP